MDYAAEMRQTYLCAAPHTFYASLAWIGSGVLGDLASKGMSILVFIIAASMIFPAGEWLRKMIKVPNRLSVHNKLPLLFTLLAFTIPLSYPIIYMACQHNINYFFPAFTVLIGAHYLPFIYGYGKNTFGLLAAILVSGGSLCGFYFKHSFSLAAYFTGSVLFFIALLHYYQTKKEIA